MTETEVIKPQDGRQMDFVASSATEVAMLGQAGGGKSYALLLDFLYDYDKPKHNGIIFRKNYRDLEDLIAKAENIFVPLGARFDRQEHVWRFKSGANLWMSYLEREAHVAKWKGWEFSWIGWDELSEFSRMPYLFMFSRLRCTDSTILKRVRSTSNPDGPGTAWVWERFTTALKEGERGHFVMHKGRDTKATPEAGVSREWFFSKRQENRILMDADPDYEKNLDLLPSERLRLAYKMGEFTVQDEPDQLIKAEWWEAALRGDNAFVPGNKSFGVDYSEGGDKTIKYDGVGNQLRKATEWEDFVPHPEMARILVNDIREGGVYQMSGGVDTVGTGSGVYTSMHDIDPVAASRVNPIRHKDYELEAAQEKSQVRLSFQNLQDQIMWKLREDFMFGRIDLSLMDNPANPEEHYENIHLLKEELLAFRFMENKLQSGRMWISSSNDLRRSSWPGGKPCLGRSPDRAKAFAIWNYSRSWQPERLPRDEKPQRTDYGYLRESKQDPVSAYI